MRFCRWTVQVLSGPRGCSATLPPSSGSALARSSLSRRAARRARRWRRHRRAPSIVLSACGVNGPRATPLSALRHAHAESSRRRGTARSALRWQTLRTAGSRVSWRCGSRGESALRRVAAGDVRGGGRWNSLRGTAVRPATARRRPTGATRVDAKCRHVLLAGQCCRCLLVIH
jgi:hypothetical protein